MEYSELLKVRHSVRKYSDKSVDRELLDRIVSEAMLAPSSKDSRSSGFMIVEDPSLIQALSEMRDSGTAPLRNAKAAIIVLGNTAESDLWDLNAAISTTYILLSAANLGLGACWVHCKDRRRVKEDPDSQPSEEYVRELLNLKDEFRPLCIVSLGWMEE